jgi:hypothetical protein
MASQWLTISQVGHDHLIDAIMKKFAIVLILYALDIYVASDLNDNFTIKYFPLSYLDPASQMFIFFASPPFSYSFTWVISVSSEHQSDVALAIFGSREEKPVQLHMTTISGKRAL